MDNPINFLKDYFNKLKRLNIDVEGLELDHIAYHASSSEDYDKLKPQFEEICSFFRDNIIGGRRVGVGKLNNPIIYDGRKISAVELVEPKEEEKHESCWEHAEFVTNEPYESILKKYPNLSWETGAMSRPSFSHITATIDDNTKIKFHNKHILDWVKLES
ncbi:VOC family protein [Patescibacteria group bacterium]